MWYHEGYMAHARTSYVRDRDSSRTDRRDRRVSGGHGIQRIMDNVKRVMFVLFFLFFLSSLTRNLFDYWKNVAFYNEVYIQYQEAKEQNLALKTHIQKGQDSKEIEKTIRNKLNLLKEGEEVVIVAVPTPRVIPTLTPNPPPDQWRETFFRQM